MKTRTLQILILILLFVLVFAVAAALLMDPSEPEPEPKPPSAASSPSEASLPTQSEPTSTQTEPLPTVTEPLPTQPEPTGLSISAAGPTDDHIGALYTRDQLEAMDSALQGYGAGSEVDDKNRPLLAQQIHSKYEKYDAHFIGPDNGKVYLTFNCTYEHEGLVAKTLDILKEKDVQCVFFVDRYFAKAYPDLLHRIFDEGHILANHCTTHPDLPNLPIDEIVSQIMTVHEFVKETYGYEMTLFRPPSGYYSEQVLAIAQSLGYTTYNWSYTYRDWDTSDQADLESTKQAIVDASHSGAIYQLHAISETNAAILGDVIDGIRAKGFEFALLG